jgi:hypothetical protein
LAVGSTGMLGHTYVCRRPAGPTAITFATVALGDFVVAELTVRQRHLAPEFPRLVPLRIPRYRVVEVLGDPPASTVKPVERDVGSWPVVTAAVGMADPILGRKIETGPRLGQTANTKRNLSPNERSPDRETTSGSIGICAIKWCLRRCLTAVQRIGTGLSGRVVARHMTCLLIFHRPI